METAQTIISDALQEILVQTAEQPLQTVDFQTGRRFLNRMMNTIPYTGLGFTQIKLPSDPVTIPDAAVEGVISNLAKKLLPQYDMPLTAALESSAKAGLANIRKITVKVQPSHMPCTLPLGSGNECYSDNLTNFYPCHDSEVLAESGGAILTESGTRDQS